MSKNFEIFRNKHRKFKLVTTASGRNYLALKPNYLTTKFFTESLLAIDMRKLK